VTVLNPSVSGDSLVGLVQHAHAGIPLGDIESLATRKGDALKTVGLLGAVAGGLLVVVAVTYDPPLCFSCQQ
jgi:hypothetical protein